MASNDNKSKGLIKTNYIQRPQTTVGTSPTNQMRAPLNNQSMEIRPQTPATNVTLLK